MRYVYRPRGGAERVHKVDLPNCCRREERKRGEGGFTCPACGAAWVKTAERESFREALLSSPEANEGHVRDWLGEEGVAEWHRRRRGAA